MKTHTTLAGTFLRTLADCLERDRASVNGWSCLVLRGLLADDGQGRRLTLLDSYLSSLEGALVVGGEGDLLLIYRGISGAGAGRLQKLVQEALGLYELPAGPAYELFQDWQQVLTEFRNQAERLGRRPELVSGRCPAGVDEAGIRHMSEVLQDSKFSRKYRSPMTIMLVEDDPVTRQLAGKLLSQDHVLVTAGNAYEAVVNYLLYAPELVFLDINLPDESGFNVLDQLTACDPDAYIVMFSGNDGIENIIDSRNRGARGFVAKPFQRDRLRHYLDERQLVFEQLRDRNGS